MVFKISVPFVPAQIFLDIPDPCFPYPCIPDTNSQSPYFQIQIFRLLFTSIPVPSSYSHNVTDLIGTNRSIPVSDIPDSRIPDQNIPFPVFQAQIFVMQIACGEGKGRWPGNTGGVGVAGRYCS